MRVVRQHSLLLLLLLCVNASAEQAQDSCSSEPEAISKAKSLEERDDWDGMLRVLDMTCRGSAEVDFYRGMALAKLQRWPEARLAFDRGQHDAPRDKRFPIELAGIAFKTHRYPAAKSALRRALKIDSRDAYAIDFLASLYFLDGNLEAALKYWNRLSKPRVEEVRLVPVPLLQPRLFDRALSLAPSDTLTRNELNSTATALNLLQVFPVVRFDLLPRPDGDFDLELRNVERNGWGSGRMERLISVLREAPFETLHFELFNLAHGASNIEASIRLDPRQRRAFASYSAPVRGNPKRRLRLWLDTRDEQWDVSESYRGEEKPAVFALKSLKVALEFESLIGGGWIWKTGAYISDRRFAKVSNFLNRPGLFAAGVALSYDAQLSGPVLELPEQRLKVTSTTQSETGRVFSSRSPFAKVGETLAWRWSPQSRGDDWQVTGSLAAARSFGAIPFDELFSLGQERDNEKFLRGFSGIDHGRKGRGPLARDFVLWNNEIDKVVVTRALWGLKAAPYIDSARAFDHSGAFGSGRLLWDAGLQLKLSILKARELTLSCGWDLRSGRHAFYLAVK